MYIYIPVLVMLLGLIIYLLVDKYPEVKEAARIAFFCRLFFTLWMFGSKV